MVILFLLFLVQFSVACACLAVNSDQQEMLAQQVSEFSFICKSHLYKSIFEASCYQYAKIIKYSTYNIFNIIHIALNV